MKVLTVCSTNSGRTSPFITEQVQALEKHGVGVDYFYVTKKGMLGYLQHLPRLMRTAVQGNYQLIHAHYGLSGLLASLQRKLPVVTTFHGSDINNKKILPYSRLAARLSIFNIVVEEGFASSLGFPKKTAVIPCGVDFDTFFTIEKLRARQLLAVSPDEKIVLFTSHFSNPVKNYSLAKEAVDKVTGARLVELKGYSRTAVNTWMNAADVLLLTSHSEGSPQVVKEALTCKLPVISTPVGDVPKLAQKAKGIEIVPYDSGIIADYLRKIFKDNKRIDDNQYVHVYDNNNIAMEIIRIYKTVIKN